MMKKRKPDFLFVLAIVVGIGVIVTMRAQAGPDPHVTKTEVSNSVAVVQTGLKKAN